MPSRVGLIRQLASKYGLDPDAVLAIASHEGPSALMGGTSIGDGGTSFGPFQLHAGGALPKGKGSAWAHSPAGIEYAIRKMAPYARGLQGQPAVQAISQYFERPRDVAGEVRDAMAHYGKITGGAKASGVGPVTFPPTSDGKGGLGPLRPPAGGPLTQQAFKSMVAASLLQGGGSISSDDLMSLAMARKQVQAAQQTFGPEPTKSPLVPSAGGGGGINELFYDPLGGIKLGKQIGAIGHHGDHVHVALGSREAQLAAIQRAQAMGLHVGEDMDSNTHPVHTQNSYHYRKFGGGLRQAADVSGDPQKMAAYYRWVASHFS